MKVPKNLSLCIFECAREKEEKNSIKYLKRMKESIILEKQKKAHEERRYIVRYMKKQLIHTDYVETMQFVLK